MTRFGALAAVAVCIAAAPLLNSAHAACGATLSAETAGLAAATAKAQAEARVALATMHRGTASDGTVLSSDSRATLDSLIAEYNAEVASRTPAEKAALAIRSVFNQLLRALAHPPPAPPAFPSGYAGGVRG